MSENMLKNSSENDTEDMPDVIYNESNGLHYRKIAGYYFPMLALPGQDWENLGFYGRRRFDYLNEYREDLLLELTLEGKLYEHLTAVDRIAEEWFENMMPKYAKAAGATEELKHNDALKWVGLMNNCKAQVEEIIYSEIIYE